MDSSQLVTKDTSGPVFTEKDFEDQELYHVDEKVIYPYSIAFLSLYHAKNTRMMPSWPHQPVGESIWMNSHLSVFLNVFPFQKQVENASYLLMCRRKTGKVLSPLGRRTKTRLLPVRSHCRSRLEIQPHSPRRPNHHLFLFSGVDVFLRHLSYRSPADLPNYLPCGRMLAFSHQLEQFWNGLQGNAATLWESQTHLP